MSTNNKTIITAEPGKPEVVITREFDAPWKKEIDDVFHRLAKILEKMQ